MNVWIEVVSRSSLLALTLALVACVAPPAEAGEPQPTEPQPPGPVSVALEPVTTDLAQPTAVTNAGDGSNRLFITQKTGEARIVEGGEVLETPFLDLSEKVSTDSERGLLDIEFHPDYAENGRFFVHYSDVQGDTVLAEYRVSEDPNVAAPDSERVLLTVPQPYSNHNGGELAFGPDGNLYLGLGDGGAGGDPEENGQDPGTLLGTVLRIGVDGEEPYTIPEDNPFADGEGGAPEVWAYGLRNPWRFSFDRETGDLWIADVGQNAYEEVNLQPASSQGGENYGWDIMEGAHCFNEESPTEPLESCDQTGLVLPVMEYPHSEGQSVTGGYVYRGAAIPELVGSYLFGDFTSGTVWGATRNEDGSYSSEPLLDTDLSVVAFGEDEAGELYVADFNGGLYRVAAEGQASE